MLAASALLFLAAAVGGAHASSADRAAGALLFQKEGCEHCHGAGGIGTDRAPSLMTVGKRMKKAQIEQQIRDGGKQMPPYGNVLSPDETKQLVDYLVHRKKASKVATPIGQSGAEAVRASRLADAGAGWE
jgi:mono/diheme cytochrome c family protein